MPRITIDNHEYQSKCGESTQLPYSCSQAAQDIFAITMLGCKRNGSFLEIGAGDPVHSNNTYLLEHEFGFTGLSIEINESLAPVWKEKRPKSNLVIADAFDFDYSQLARQIDYLQVDIDQGSLEILDLVKDIRFSVITFEHDCFSGDLWPMWQSREILIDQGYELLVNNVTIEPGRGVGTGLLQFEDWYVDPLVIDRTMIHLYQWLDETAYGFQQRPARQEPARIAKYPRDILFRS